MCVGRPQTKPPLELSWSDLARSSSGMLIWPWNIEFDALNQLTVAAALVYWPKPVGKRGYDDDDGFSATAAMMQKYGSV